MLVSFDLTMRSNLSVGMPIDLICYQRDSLEIQMRRRFDEGDAYFTALSSQWSEGVRHVFSLLNCVGRLTADVRSRPIMQIRVGYELIYDCAQPTPMILTLNIHFTRVSDIVVPDHLVTSPSIPITGYRDGFGNWCSRIVAPPGQIRLSTDAIVNDTGRPDEVAAAAQQIPVQNLPEETLLFLLGSRYCETDRLSEAAWDLFGNSPPGWARVQAICDFVHNHIVFGYEHARSTKTAWDVFNERKGVCRDYAHLAVAFCRCMNFPARYCTGYLGDIACRPRKTRWISRPGSMSTLAVAGIPLMPVTTSHGSAEC